MCILNKIIIKAFQILVWGTDSWFGVILPPHKRCLPFHCVTSIEIGEQGHWTVARIPGHRHVCPDHPCPPVSIEMQ